MNLMMGSLWGFPPSALEVTGVSLVVGHTWVLLRTSTLWISVRGWVPVINVVITFRALALLPLVRRLRPETVRTMEPKGIT